MPSFFQASKIDKKGKSLLILSHLPIEDLIDITTYASLILS